MLTNELGNKEGPPHIGPWNLHRALDVVPNEEKGQCCVWRVPLALAWYPQYVGSPQPGRLKYLT